MSHFHRHRLLSGIRESHQVPLQANWAYAIRMQARLILLPLFRELIVGWRTEKTGKRPIISDLASELLMGFFKSGNLHLSVHGQLEKEITKFLESLTESEVGILKFYFLSQDSEVEDMYQEVLDREKSDDSTPEEDEIETGKIFQIRHQQLNQDELIGFLMGEVGEIENILSDSDLVNGLDTEAITRINENFSNYIDLSYGEISLIQVPLKEWDFWEKVTAEEHETVGKRMHTNRGLEWVECWLLPDGRIRTKGEFLDEPDRDEAAIQALRKELPEILKSVHEQLTQHYGLFDSHIHYTFFTRRKTLENVVPFEGIQFFTDQIETHGSDDFEPNITLDIRRYKDKMLQEWGTQISLGIEDRHWLTEDEKYEFRVWVLTIEGEETPLETRFTENQLESIIQSILGNIHRCYQLDYEN